MHFLLADGGMAGLLTALGIDWKVLLLNGAAFLVVVWVMGKFVYPPLIKSLDARLEDLEKTSTDRKQAEEQLKAAEKSATDIIGQARVAADEVLAEAKAEASELAKASQAKADEQAKRIVSEARAQLGRDVEAARVALKTETAKLVAQATEAVLSEKLDDSKDAALVSRALEGHI